jgi:hypothetical protein
VRTRKSGDVLKMFTRLGVRGRLFLSFCAISAFAVIAAATAMNSFLEVGKALERIIDFACRRRLLPCSSHGRPSESSPRPGAPHRYRILREAVAKPLTDRAALTHAARESGIAIDRIHGLLQSATRWQGEGFDLIHRVQLSPEEIAISLDLGPLSGETGMLVRHLVPASIRRRGVEMRLVLRGLLR